MLSGKKILGLIPARGDSKGLSRKNVRPFHGKPLIAWSIEAGLGSNYIDRLVLSSDNEEIMETARRHGCDVPFVRPSSLATDAAPVSETILDALDRVGQGFDYLVLLQPTSPLRQTEDIDACIELCIGRGHPSVVTVSPLPKPASFYGMIGADGSLTRSSPPGVNLASGSTPCMLNGAVYVAPIEVFRRHRTFVVPGTVAHMMPYERSWDIDGLFDFLVAELLFPYLIEGQESELGAVRSETTSPLGNQARGETSAEEAVVRTM